MVNANEILNNTECRKDVAFYVNVTVQIETCFRPKIYYNMVPAVPPPALPLGPIYIFVFFLGFPFSYFFDMTNQV